jgi:DMSO/TMAO reductase YedYZ molybdopterin-dependent catalytic subunit
MLLLLSLALLPSLAGCLDEEDGSSPEGTLTVTDGSESKSYTREDLEKFPASEAAFEGTTYKGVQLKVLLEDAGFDLDGIKVVKATALDDFSANYERELFTKDDTLVAYQLGNGNALSDDDAPFRMVLPDQEGRLNPRQLKEIRVLQ